MNEVLAPDWELERLRKAKTDVTKKKAAAATSGPYGKGSGGEGRGTGSGGKGWKDDWSSSLNDNWSSGGKDWNSAEKGWHSGGDGAWSTSSQQQWDPTGPPSSHMPGNPAHIDMNQLSTHGHWGVAGGSPAVSVPVGGGQNITLPSALPANYIGLSRAETGELIDSL